MLVDMKTMLAPAKENGFAVPAFNVSSSMLLRGAIEGGWVRSLLIGLPRGLLRRPSRRRRRPR